MVLPDTSIWIDYLRGSEPGLQVEIDRGALVTCGPVVAELLAGARGAARLSLATTLGKAPFADLDRAAWDRIGVAASELGERGETVPLTDIGIAVAAVSVDAAVWTRDGDFTRIASALPELRLRP